MKPNISIIGFGKDYSNQIRELLLRNNRVSSVNTLSDIQNTSIYDCENTTAVIMNGYAPACIQWIRNCVKATGSKPPASIIIGNISSSESDYPEERRSAPRMQISHKELTSRKLTNALQQLQFSGYLPEVTPEAESATRQSINECLKENSPSYEASLDLEPESESSPEQITQQEITRIGVYKVNQLLGNGGMGRVYRAQSPENESVAIKLIDSSKVLDFRLLDRFIAEYELLTRVDHPHVIQVHDQGFTDSHLYIVMELLANESLKLHIEKGLAVENTITFAINICHAMATIHDLDILHRDIKPTNILFDENGQPVITDFGIAKITEQSNDVELTMAGEAVGTPAYMSPEQALGHEASASSDMYAFGAMLYQMLTGKLPFQARSPLVMMRKQVEMPPPHLPPELMDLDPVIQRLLSKQPSRRYQSAWDLHAELEQFAM